MKTARLIRLWELGTAWGILIALVVLCFMAIDGSISLNMNSGTILCFVIPAAIKFYKAKALKKLEK